ncbi:dermonecrotic toxin domain-containing protein [Pseudomonas sp. BTN1]|uniref:dermonecrotic toxin domain-containing protein n=1 Tax=Pseudomonas sp. BTN1 TaxID=1750647 RepID=UPI00093E3337|nr:DUF6543 domain-containing protein [Pseudomonas sp. BTN1]OKO46161.1 hypothetical protein BMH52_22015 [Pseudomonas sp. BTN1]
MPILLPPATTDSFQGRHIEHLKNAVPDWLTGASLARINTFRTAKLPLARPYPHAPTEAHSPLKQAIAEHWRAQNTLDKRLGDINDLYAFAEPLLKAALFTDYGDIDVKNIFLRLYTDAALAWWTVNVTRGVHSKTLSLLDAALSNFSAKDRFVDFAFLSAQDPRGQQDILHFPHRRTGVRLDADTFKDICRSLDIGARYQASLRQRLGFDNPPVAVAVRDEAVSAHKAALKSAAHLAQLKGDLRADALETVRGLIEERADVRLDGLPINSYNLSLLDCPLTGILLFMAQPASGRLIAYVPGDPEHPVKEYPDPIAFVRELTRQLKGSSMQTTGPYPQFFSQFVPHQLRGRFFAQLNARLSQKTERPTLQFRLQDITEDYQNRSDDPAADNLWRYLYRVQLNKIVNDARDMAVSTAYVDHLARWAWWDNLQQVLSDLLNASLLLITPFVPLVGELMLAYTAYQVLDEVFEGIVDWSQGQRTEAAQHLLDVAQNLIQAALFAGAGKLGEVIQLKPSSFVDGLHPVRVPDGQLKLWNPDLRPYAQQAHGLPADSLPSPSGLHEHQGKHLLALNGEHYEVLPDADTEEHRINHPTRTDAYRPQVFLNGDGAVLHEGEQPQTWDSATLMRRLGHRVEGFTDQQLEQMRRASGTDEAVLRAMHLYHEPMPPLLAGTLRRFEAQAYPAIASERIRTGQPLASDPSSDWFIQTVTELDGWPSDKAIEVFLNPDLSGRSIKVGNPDAASADTLPLSFAQVMSGQLPEHVLGFLDEEASRRLLGGDIAQSQRVQHLRDLLADHVLHWRRDFTDNVYRQVWEMTDDPEHLLLRQSFPHLDTAMQTRLLSTASSEEHTSMAEQRLPLRLHNQARELDVAAQSVQAFEGFYAAPPLPVTTERMALNTLKVHSDSFADLHLQIREQTPTGTLRCEAGPVEATIRRVLVPTVRGYDLFDEAGTRLSSHTDLYEAVLGTLPADKAQALGYHPGQGAQLKQWLMDQVASLAERRVVLAEPPTYRRADRETVQLLGGGGVSRCAEPPVETYAQHARQTLQLLFPTLDEQRLELFIDSVPPRHLRNLLNELTEEKQRLHVELQTWKDSPTQHARGSRDDRVQRARRRHLAVAIERCWGDRFAQHTDAYGHPQSGARLDLHHWPLPSTLPRLTANFEHVTALNLSNTEFGPAHSDFLKHFPTLRSLDLHDNKLMDLPPALVHMRLLKDLDLSGNDLTFSPDDIRSLRKARRLERLELSNNPLVLAPDISLMPALRHLGLSRTAITQWPRGLFAQPRVDEFLLDLRANPIDALPDATAGTPEARVIARARLDRNALTVEALTRYEHYRTAAGLDPNRTYEPMGNSGPWMLEADAQTRPIAEQVWNAVEHEHGSQGFFEVIRYLELPEFFEQAEDRLRYDNNRRAMTQRVWRLIRAAHEDTPLRERLFKMSSFPGLCADAGAQIFNEMGIEVMASEALRYSQDAAECEEKLVTLAKGSARLKLLGKVAGEDIAQRVRPVSEGGQGQRFRSDVRDGVPGEVDEVDVHLAYQTDLAARLDLPWISNHMLYRATANVSEEQINHAYTQVLALSEGDGLVNQMLLEPYWEQYLRNSHDQALRDNDQLYSTRFLQLDDLQTAQAQWARADELTAEKKALLRDTLRTLGEALQAPDSVVFADEPMSDEVYNGLLNDLGYKEKEWLRQLTRQALARDTGRSNRAS